MTAEAGQPRGPETGSPIVSERFWCGGIHPVCAVLVRDPVTGLKAYIGGTDNAWAVKRHGTRLDPDLARVLFPAYRSQKWAGW